MQEQERKIGGDGEFLKEEKRIKIEGENLEKGELRKKKEDEKKEKNSGKEDEKNGHRIRQEEEKKGKRGFRINEEKKKIIRKNRER